jgi:intracellular septation protein
MHPALDLLPLAAFLAAYYFADIYVATIALMITMPLVAIWGRLQTGRFSSMHLASTALVVGFGALTLALHDQRFIQWKPTVFFWALAAAFLGSRWIGQRTLTERLMSAALGDGGVAISAERWRAVNYAWVAFYALMGVANAWFVLRTSEATWVTFKTFGITGLTLVFAVGQGVWLMRGAAQQDPQAQ